MNKKEIKQFINTYCKDGRKLTADKINSQGLEGIFPKLPREEYEAIDALNFSAISPMLQKTEKHWKSFYENGIEQTDAMKMGRASHMAVLEPKKFPKTYLRMPGYDEIDNILAEGIIDEKQFNAIKKDPSRMYDGRLKHAKVIKKHYEGIKDRVALEPDEYDRHSFIREGVMKNAEAARLLNGGFAEVTVVWTQNGVKRKGQLDYLKLTSKNRFDIVNLKTTTDAHPRKFQYDMKKYEYVAHDAYYGEGIQHIMGAKSPIVVLNWIAVEKSFPFYSQVFWEDMRRAIVNSKLLKIERAVKRYKEILDGDEPRGYYDPKNDEYGRYELDSNEKYEDN